MNFFLKNANSCLQIASKILFLHHFGQKNIEAIVDNFTTN